MFHSYRCCISYFDNSKLRMHSYSLHSIRADATFVISGNSRLRINLVFVSFTNSEGPHHFCSLFGVFYIKRIASEPDINWAISENMWTQSQNNQCYPVNKARQVRSKSSLHYTLIWLLYTAVHLMCRSIRSSLPVSYLFIFYWGFHMIDFIPVWTDECIQG